MDDITFKKKNNSIVVRNPFFEKYKYFSALKNKYDFFIPESIYIKKFQTNFELKKKRRYYLFNSTNDKKFLNKKTKDTSKILFFKKIIRNKIIEDSFPNKEINKTVTILKKAIRDLPNLTSRYIKKMTFNNDYKNIYSQYKNIIN